MAFTFNQTSGEQDVIKELQQRVAALEHNQNLMVQVCTQLLERLGQGFNEELLLSQLQLICPIYFLNNSYGREGYNNCGKWSPLSSQLNSLPLALFPEVPPRTGTFRTKASLKQIN